jgi:type II secretory pathway component PulF
VASRSTALAVAVGRFNGRLTPALQRLPDRRLAPQWLELASRLVYPLLILGMLLMNVVFLMTFIVPKFEKIFADLKVKLPAATQTFMEVSRWFARYAWASPLVWLLLLILVNVVLFSSRVKWHLPLVGWIYRLYARGQFLQLLGLMLQTGKPLPEILDRALESDLLPGAVTTRVNGLAVDLYQGRPLAESLARRGLVTAPMHGLVAAAERAQNLPWALEELGDTLLRRSARISHRLSMTVFPLAIVACACVVAFVAVAMFLPLVALINEGSSHG